uniref:Secreted protein n=1 Tax=Ixodes scapularis TaxID=6945 RepID=A0A4D5RZR7_IXOSC
MSFFFFLFFCITETFIGHRIETGSVTHEENCSVTLQSLPSDDAHILQRSSVTFLWLFGCFPIIEGSCRLIMGDTVLCSHLHGVQQCGEASRGQPLSISVPGALCSSS